MNQSKISQLYNYFKKFNITSSYQDFRNILMNSQGIQDCIFSQQSSDIVPVPFIDQSQSYTSFKTAKEEASNFSLYSDINSYQVLNQPELDGKDIQLLYQRQPDVVIFDSIVLNQQLLDQYLEIMRINKILKNRTYVLKKRREQKKNQLFLIKSKRDGFVNSNHAVKTIFSNMDTKIKKIKDEIIQNKIFQDVQIKKSRQATIGVVQQFFRQQYQQLNKQLIELKHKNQSLNEKKKQMSSKIEELNKTIYEKKKQRRKRLYDQRIQKEENEIRNLASKIQQMERILGANKKK